MSRPYALPDGPTRFADSSTSSPPPDPRSRTVSPAVSTSSAVGLPQPSEAATAFSGSSAVWSCAYRFEVTGSQPLLDDASPQHDVVPVAVTRSAACPYFCFTRSLMPSSLMPRLL